MQKHEQLKIINKLFTPLGVGSLELESSIFSLCLQRLENFHCSIYQISFCLLFYEHHQHQILFSEEHQHQYTTVYRICELFCAINTFALFTMFFCEVTNCGKITKSFVNSTNSPVNIQDCVQNY